jgi:hypothetical protein
LPKNGICAKYISVFKRGASARARLRRTTNGFQVASIDAIAYGAKASADPGAKKVFLPQGVANPLKRLKTAKEIKGNQSLFL